MTVRYTGPESAHFNGKRFFSPYGEAPKTFWDVLKWKIRGSARAWPKSLSNSVEPHPASQVAKGDAVLTFVNHATMLVQVQGLNFLTDPLFSDRTSPFAWMGPKRIRPPGISLEALPKIDVVLISHNHYDHLDLASCRELVRKHDPLFLIPLGDRVVMKGIPGLRFQEMDWWQSTTAQDTRFTYLPAQHWSARGPFDRNASLWGSFMVEAPGFTLYFAGDTGLAPHFREIAEKFPQIDLALLPIGAYEPRWFMKGQHMNPLDAVQAHQELRTKVSIGIHFGTWQLTDEGVDEPVLELAKARARAGLSADQFLVLEQGETRTFHRDGFA